MTSVTVQVASIRFAGRGSIFTAMPVDGDRKTAHGPLTVRMPEHVLGRQLMLTGDLWALQGEHETYKGYRQFRADQAVLVRPHGKNMIATLSGPRFPGIGRTKAMALWDRFGTDLRRLLDAGDADALSEVVSAEMAQTLIAGWRDLNPSDVIEWLDQHRFPIRLGQRLVDFYGPTAVDKLKADPYRLLAFRESWARVDDIARTKIGVEADDPRRAHAAVCQVLYDAWDKDGSTALDEPTLLERVQNRLGGSAEEAKRAIAVNDGGGWLLADTELYQSSGAWLMEQYITRRLERMVALEDMAAQRDAFIARHPVYVARADYNLITSTLNQWQRDHHTLGSDQREAVELATANAVAVISGGAGVGKTTVLKALYAALNALDSEVVQMALSGRAAKRMHEATGRHAITIAGFLREKHGRDAKDNQPDPDRPDTRTYVIDEASMLDVPTLYQILRRVGPGARLILVGDDLQLPPIGAGLTFHLMCREGGLVPRKHLAQVYRQEGSTGIPAISQAIRNGIWPDIPTYAGPDVGVSVLPCAEAETGDAIARLHDELSSSESDLQILATTRGERRETPGSVIAINKRLYNDRLAGRAAVRLIDGLSGFCEGCPIMFTENDWDRSVYNGSLGIIVEAFDEPMVILDSDNETLTPWASASHRGDIPGDRIFVCRAEIEGKAHALTQDDLDRRVQRAFAITVHKAQGSQWTRVIIPVSSGRLLDRTLVYTAITRGIRQVVLVGDIAAAEAAVKAQPKALARQVGLRLRAA